MEGIEEFYDSFANSYDVMTFDQGRWDTERPFLSSLLKGFGWRKILDAGCGTGGEAIALVRLGAHMTGVDATWSLLEIARQKAQDANVEIEWFHDDIRVLKHPVLRMFDAVFCRGNTLPHLLTTEDLKATLTTFNRVIRPGGHLVLGWLNYARILNARERLVGARASGDKLILRFYDFHDDHLVFNVLTMDKVSTVVGNTGVTWNSTTLKPWTFEDVEPVLRDTGWSVICQWGGTDRSPFVSEHSKNILLVAKSKP